MKEEDYKLSMRISPRGKIDSANLRQLLINRLSDTYKAVLRRSLRSENKMAVYCEECTNWTQADGYPEQWTCPKCSTRYRIEFAIYEEVEPRP